LAAAAYDCQAIKYNSGQKNIGGVYGMFIGDGNANGIIDINDKTNWANQAGTYGYKSADFNMNSQVDNTDKNDNWIENNNNSSQIPD
jgi:hypothetical protein